MREFQDIVFFEPAIPGRFFATSDSTFADGDEPAGLASATLFVMMHTL